MPDLAYWLDHPGSDLILPPETDRKDKTLWLAERVKGLGGSDISAILGLNEYSSAYHVWLDKTGRGQELEESPAMRWGKLHEPALKQAFTEDMGIEVVPTGLHRSKLYPIMLVTPDGFTADGGVFESKTGSVWQKKHWEGENLSDHAALQVMHSMAVTGKRHAWVVALLGGNDFQIRKVEADTEMIDELIGFEVDWWEKHVVRDVPPPATAVALEAIKSRFQFGDVPELEVDEDTEAHIRKLLAKKKEAADKAKKFEIEAKVIEAQLREIAGHAELIKSGETELFTLPNNGTFSPTRFKELVPEPPMKMAPVMDMDAVKEKYPTQYRQSCARVLRPKVK